MAKFLNHDGLNYFYQKIKVLLDNKSGVSHTHNYAGSSSVGGAATTATKATQDSTGQQINTTYLKGLSVNGKTLTYTKGDDTTGTLTTQDTTYSVATTSAAGLLSSTDKSKLDGIATGAQVNTVTGIKGNAETSYRTGNINITPANIGAAVSSHGNHVPITGTASNAIFLRNDNTWAEVTPGNIGALPTSGGTITGALSITNTTDSTSYTTGALKVSGGVGIAKSLNVGTSVTSPEFFGYNSKLTLALLGYCGRVQLRQYAFEPGVDNTHTLGSSSLRFKQLFAGTSTISTSDRNVKESIEYFDENDEIFEKMNRFYDRLRPVMYKFKGGLSTSGRRHCGYISQDIEDSLKECDMSPLDFAGFCKDPHYAELEDGTPDFDKILGYDYSLRYEEFIALNTMRIKRLESMFEKILERIGE